MCRILRLRCVVYIQEDDASVLQQPFRETPLCMYYGHTADVLDLTWSKVGHYLLPHDSCYYYRCISSTEFLPVVQFNGQDCKVSI